MKLGIVKEVHPGEKRVAASPQVVARLAKRGFDTIIEPGAGTAAKFPDAAYIEAGATIAADARSVWSQADIMLKVRPPEQHPDLDVHESDLLSDGCTLLSTLWPGQNEELVDRLSKLDANVSVIAMDKIPRISRAQKMDVLSSMANIAGYRAVVEAAGEYGSFFTGQFTAAGKVPPATVLVIGAGVAGLAAIAAARGLGARVRAFDTRLAVKDQVKSLGGEFLELQFEESGEGEGGYAKTMSKEFIDAEMAMFAEQAKEVDIVITTALIPGRPAPKLWKDYMVEAMKPGSVIVDMAAEQGGNCDLTVHGERVVAHDVTILGYSDLPSRLPTVSSDLYGTNLYHLLDEMGGGEEFRFDLENEVVRQALVVHEGKLTWPPPPLKKPAPKPVAKKPEPKKPKLERVVDREVDPPVPQKPKLATYLLGLTGLALVGGWLFLRLTMDQNTAMSPSTYMLLQHLTVFVLSVFVGWQVVWNVTAALHTPLMSVTNAISGIIIIGGMLQVGDNSSAAVIVGAIATFFAGINVAGGFLVTQRMLKMFRK